MSGEVDVANIAHNLGNAFYDAVGFFGVKHLGSGRLLLSVDEQTALEHGHSANGERMAQHLRDRGHEVELEVCNLQAKYGHTCLSM